MYKIKFILKRFDQDIIQGGRIVRNKDEEVYQMVTEKDGSLWDISETSDFTTWMNWRYAITRTAIEVEIDVVVESF